VGPEKIILALRVLTAINERRRPAEQDIAVFRSFEDGHGLHNLDGIACSYIESAQAQMKAERGKGLSKAAAFGCASSLRLALEVCGVYL
jgi:hypothetical protein